jgi:transaldolase
VKNSPLIALAGFGQSVWVDFIRRGALESGDLARMIANDGVRGVTSNPAIFEKAIAGSHDYDSAIRSLVRAGESVDEMLETLIVEDIQRAADLFAPLYEHTIGGDGFVSIEVSPDLAHDTAATIAQAEHLWARVARPNIFIKVPATEEGVPAIQKLIDEGINVNVTLLFGLSRYREVVHAYLSGLEARAARGADLLGIASVASFFLSRIDTLVDPRLTAISRAAGDKGDRPGRLQGEVAIACAKLAYQTYREIFESDRFAVLAKRDARTQRVLWASTGTKNPAYSDVKYVDALVGPNTVTTLPLETLAAYRDHGDPEPRLEQGMERAREVLAELGALGINLEEVSRQLEAEGVEKFSEPWSRLRSALETKRAAA